MQDIFIGIDGGASKSIARVETATGVVMATAVGGPANVRISVSQSVQSITRLLHHVLSQCDLSIEQQNLAIHCGIGIAGCEIESAKQAFIQQLPKFASLALLSDAEAACLGAHRGKDGGIIIIGTGVVGYLKTREQNIKIGGWGFPHDDQGGGAWLGLAAANHTLKAYDKRTSPSDLAKKVLNYFDNQPEALVIFVNQATPADYAKLAPLVIQSALSKCSIAQSIMAEAAKYIYEIAHTMMVASFDQLKCALVGGIAPHIEDYLSDNLKRNLVPCALPPEAGALLAVKLKTKEDHGE